VLYVYRGSVSTLGQFTTYVETANNNQRLDIEHIQAYVMDELQRQNAAANHTKQICEQKLVELQYQLEDVSRLRWSQLYSYINLLALLTFITSQFVLACSEWCRSPRPRPSGYI